MTGETDQDIQLLNRRALIDVLEMLAAGPEKQVAYVHGRNFLPVDELIAERRAVGAREDAEAEAWLAKPAQ